MPTFYEFFAGGGMARAGLGSRWRCVFANEIDPKKSRTYVANWGKVELLIQDVATVAPDKLLGEVDLAWASFPCQDLSLAGNGAGINGGRSGMFWAFWDLIRSLRSDDRAPKAIVLENVCGLLTSNGGRDFSALITALTSNGYVAGAMVMDAAHFVPQSRPRLFIVACRSDIEIPTELAVASPVKPWHTAALIEAHQGLSAAAQAGWQWWSLPAPTKREMSLASVIEKNPKDVRWHSPAETLQILRMMSPLNRAKVNQAKKSGKYSVGTIYRRTRPMKGGVKVQRAEIRFDDLSGCLRTPAGGSSRQLIMVVARNEIRTRLISARETARLMGLPETYILPDSYNEAYHLTGDGLAVPVVRFLAENLLEKLLPAFRVKSKTSAMKKRSAEAVSA